MVSQFDPRQCLPSSAEFTDSDDTPVDNELQNLIPNLLEAILAMIWSEREDWFFGVDMGIYFNPASRQSSPMGEYEYQQLLRWYATSYQQCGEYQQLAGNPLGWV
jgi:Uma2 family endonuclease